jgi:2,3-bisphosphoglycerate-independent phosphoglycerate mutase
MNKKVILLILDGWGITQDPNVSAIFNAKTPYINSLYDQYPSSELRTDGMHVGLPEGQMGNSEVGHMNLGAGRIVYQNLAKINIAVREGELSKEKELLNAFKYAKEHHKNIHLLRDCDPKSGSYFIHDIQEHMKKTTGELATVTGRYYAMDRDKRWERVKLAYDALVNGIGENSTNADQSIQKSYGNNITDEFIKPIIMIDENGNPKATIKEDDVVIFFNFRTDRGRQLTNVLSQRDNDEFLMKKRSLYFVTLTNYDKTFKDIKVIYNSDNIENTLGEVLETAKKTQIRIAETEKYPHVTFFFSGGREEEFIGEKRLLCASPKVATYDLKPEMSAYEIRDAIIPELEKGDVDFVCLNFANGDMVGHTGVFDAAVKACETVDHCTKDVITSGLENEYTTILIADHGNCETMMNPDGSPHTAHTTNPVPIILIDKEIKLIKDGVLGDIAPTILELMGVEQPKEMTRKSLL